MAKTKKIHPAEAADRELVGQAVSFNVHLRRSPTSKINEPAQTLREAVAIADRIRAEFKGRDALIYAILADDRQVLVPKDMQVAAREPEFEDSPEPVAAPKAAKARKAAKADKPLGKRAAILEAAKAGKIPPAPDFSAPTHARFRKLLGDVVALVKAKDVAALQALEIKPISTSPKAVARYRDLAVIALQSRGR